MSKPLEQQDITDPDMQGRVIAVVEKAIATADPRRVFTDTVEGQQRTYVPWTRKGNPDTIAARWTPLNRCIYTLENSTVGDVDAGRTLTAEVGDPTVTWWPGREDVDACEFLAWWEALVERSAHVDWDASFVADHTAVEREV